MLGLIVLQLGLGIRISVLTRDPATLQEPPAWAGLVSYLGILLWAIAGVIALASGWRLRGAMRSRCSLFLMVGGGLSLLLAADDLLLLHESVVPHRLGVPEVAVLGFYGLFTLAHLATFRGLVAATGPRLLLTALSLFALSLVVDAAPALLFDPSTRIESVPELLVDGYYLLKDGAKLIGIMAWSGYYVQASRHLRAPTRSG